MDEGKEGGMWEIHFKHIGDIGGSKSQNRVRASVCLPPSPSVSALNLKADLPTPTSSQHHTTRRPLTHPGHPDTNRHIRSTATLPTSAENAVSVHFFSFFFFCCFSFLVFEAV